MPYTGRFFEVRFNSKISHLAEQTCKQLEELECRPKERLAQIASTHAAGKEPKQSRKLAEGSSTSNSEFQVTISSVRFRYQVLEDECYIEVFDIDAPDFF